MLITESARFDEIMSFYIDFESFLLKSCEEKPKRFSNGKNIFHSLFLNKDDTFQTLLSTLKAMIKIPFSDILL